MGTSVESVEGYTVLDTPFEKNLHCRFEVDDENEIVLKFNDPRLAEKIKLLAVLNKLVSFRMDYEFVKDTEEVVKCFQTPGVHAPGCTKVVHE